MDLDPIFVIIALLLLPFILAAHQRSYHDLLHFLNASMIVLWIILQDMQASASAKDLGMSSQSNNDGALLLLSVHLLDLHPPYQRCIIRIGNRCSSDYQVPNDIR